MDANAKRWARPLKAGRPSEMIRQPSKSRIVRSGRTSDRTTPLHFIRRETVCRCGHKVEFIHERHGLCLICCVRERRVLDSVPLSPANDRGLMTKPNAADSELAERIRIASECREGLGTDECVMPRLQAAMSGKKG